MHDRLNVDGIRDQNDFFGAQFPSTMFHELLDSLEWLQEVFFGIGHELYGSACSPNPFQDEWAWIKNTFYGRINSGSSPRPHDSAAARRRTLPLVVLGMPPD